MKKLFLRTSATLVCAFALFGCGGEDATLVLPVNISGVNKEGLKLSVNGGAAQAVPLGVSVFSFPDLVATDSDFEIKIVGEPSNAKCTIVNGKGKTGAFSPNNILVSCLVNQYNVTGTVSGLKTAGLVVINGADRTEIPANATTFTLTKKDSAGTVTGGQVGDGYPYGLAIFQQPAAGSGVCTLENGTGVMGAADVTNVKITCI